MINVSAANEMIGKTIKGLVMYERSRIGPHTCLYLVFTDGTALELYMRSHSPSTFYSLELESSKHLVSDGEKIALKTLESINPEARLVIGLNEEL
ncbi:MAG: hypothetical protein JEZ06_17100 [Anaerolineaceae bacterium]|nr:hypothetical protein [Anaerolineaceae bacterium]